LRTQRPHPDPRLPLAQARGRAPPHPRLLVRIPPPLLPQAPRPPVRHRRRCRLAARPHPPPRQGSHPPPPRRPSPPPAPRLRHRQRQTPLPPPRLHGQRGEVRVGRSGVGFLIPRLGGEGPLSYWKRIGRPSLWASSASPFSRSDEIL